MDRIKLAVKWATGTVSSVVGTAAAWDVQLRVLVALGGLGVSIVTIWSIVDSRRSKRQVERAEREVAEVKARLERVQLLREAGKLCDWCRAGHTPPRCPFEDTQDWPEGCRRRNPKPETRDGWAG